MKNEIATAHTVVFLGFGFHEMNMGLLTVPESKVNRVFGTAHGLSVSDTDAVENRIRGAFNRRHADIKLRSGLESTQLFDEFRFGLVS
jgi:hypothetical protein